MFIGKDSIRFLCKVRKLPLGSFFELIFRIFNTIDYNYSGFIVYYSSLFYRIGTNF